MITATRESEVVEKVPKGLLIGGEWRDGEGGRTLAVDDPSTGEALCEVADASAADAMAALDAACEAQAEWRKFKPRDRGEILRASFEEIIDRIDELALLMTLEMGKPIAESKGELTYAAEFFRWFAEEAPRISGQYMVNPTQPGRIMTIKQPVGPCLLITPWNFPMAMGTRKIGPAVAAGCTMVVKPAKQTPLSMLALAEILGRHGLPPGVLNVVTSSSSGSTMEPLIRDGRIRKLSFTGSTEVGRVLIEQAAEQILRVSMELGGNAPFLVFDDADLDVVIEAGLLAKMRNMGEACTAANRFLVSDKLADEFTERFAQRIGDYKVGRGTEDGVQVGPLVDKPSLDKVSELVQDAIGRGATAVVGGERVGERGYFYAPTVLGGVTPDARVMGEEIFGPVSPVLAVGSEEEAITRANDTEYGLIAYIFTRDLERALRVTESLDTGMVAVNLGVISNPAAPFGGIKHSGYGREGGREGIEEYLDTKFVGIRL